MKLSRQTRKATASVEFAVLLPVLMVFLLGTWEVGRLIEVKQLLSNAAREGARQAAAGNMTTAEVKTCVVEHLHRNGITAVTESDVTVTNIRAGAATDPNQADQLDEYEVTVSIPFDSVKWVFLDQVTSTSSLSASANWHSMRDKPVVVNSAIPLN